MQFAIDEAYLPAILSAAPMTDEEFAEFCSEYPDYFVQMSAEGEIFLMPPNYSLTGSVNQIINFQLVGWALNDRSGIVTDGTAGFKLPNGARRSPDSAWTRKDRVLGLTTVSRKTFWHLCPDFIIELRSQTDRLPILRNKMLEWMDNGAQLAWLIDPQRRVVEVYRPDVTPEILENPETVFGDGPVSGFILDLRIVWDPLGS